MTRNEMIDIMWNDKNFRKSFNEYIGNTSLSVESIYEIYINHLISIREEKINKILENI
jgi:hypothetical protein